MTAHEQFADDLALHALGVLVGEECSALRRHLEDCSACRRELEQLRGDLGLLALEAAAPMPPQRARRRLLDAIAREPRLRAVPMRRRWWSLVPVFTSLVLAIFGILLWRDNAQQKRRLDTLKSEMARNQAALDHANLVLAILQSPEAVRVTLAAGKPQPQGKAIYMPNRGALLFMASNLAPSPPEKTYELWLIPMKGNPIPAGTFKPDAGGSATILMPPLPPGVAAKAFAVTIEKEGGSQTPTMPIIMAGEGQ